MENINEEMFLNLKQTGCNVMYINLMQWTDTYMNMSIFAIFGYLLQYYFKKVTIIRIIKDCAEHYLYF